MTILANNKKTILLLSTISALQSPISAAENMEVFTITGSHINQNITVSMPKVTIDAETIAALSPNSVADVLSTVPGIDIFEQGGIGGLTFLSLRGGDPNFVIFMLDGVKMNDPTNSRGGAFDLNTIDPAIIEKIEIYYGSFSTIYGSDALSGVISITTKKAQPDHVAIASIKVGSNQMIGGTLHLTTELADIANLTLTSSSQNNDNSTFGDAFKRQGINTTIRSIGDGNSLWQLGAYYANGQSQMFPEDSGGDRLALIRTAEYRDYRQQNYSANFRQNITKKLKLDLSATLAKRQEKIANPGIAAGVLDAVPAIDSDSDYRQSTLNSVVTYQMTNHAAVAMGASLTRENGSMDSTIDFGVPVPANYILNRATKALFIESSVQASDKLNLTGSLRYDAAGRLKITTKRLTAHYQINHESSISTEYSEGFKLPSFFALAHPFVGNSALKPETSKNYDVTFNQQISQQLRFRLSAYQNSYQNLVDFDPELFTNVNRLKVRARGTEWSINYQPLTPVNLSANISYNDIETFDRTIKMRRRPLWKGNFQINYQALNTLYFTTQVKYNDSYFDSSIPTGMIIMADRVQINLATRWQITPETVLRLTIKNIANTDTEQAVGFTNTGTAFTASIASNF